eukprot:TRINITY_DN3886_c0_g1_i13.p1 TRINITY_DN3886_c0_g1~~TRINITY_DN3886_c0_g1_i13.p1  ORF type:complete len:720 (+),score=134.93 TRINITY_DN3886_c0_g1_i13:190-2349(+)
MPKKSKGSRPNNSDNTQSNDNNEERTTLPNNSNSEPFLNPRLKKIWKRRTNIQTIDIENPFKKDNKKVIKKKKGKKGGFQGIQGRLQKQKKNKKLAPENSVFGDIEKKVEKYKRVDTIDFEEDEIHRNLARKLKQQNQFALDSAVQAAKVEVFNQVEPGFLESENPMEKTWTVTQADLADNVDMATTRKMFDFTLELGPYQGIYSPNGTHLLLVGSKGHVSLMDWKKAELKTELQLKETARSGIFLQNETMFALAQYRYGYVYDNTGTEIHRLRDRMGEIYQLEYLPYHWLLCSIGMQGQLTYQDHSTGKIVAQYSTHKGSCNVMRHNPSNGVMLLGHNDGAVTMWTPNINSPAVTILAHKGRVANIAIEKSGKYLATVGLDTSLKIWDLRTYKELDTYYSPDKKYMSGFTSVDISQTGLVSASCGNTAYVWKDVFTKRADELYMTYKAPSEIRSLRFCPFEDILGVGHAKGFSSVLIPGSGEPNFDSMENNPFQTKKQRREGEVRSLLEKIPADMIALDPYDFGTIKPDTEFLDKRKTDLHILTDLDKRELMRQQNFEEKMRIMKEKEEERERIKSNKPRPVLERFKKRDQSRPKKEFSQMKKQKKKKKKKKKKKVLCVDTTASAIFAALGSIPFVKPLQPSSLTMFLKTETVELVKLAFASTTLLVFLLTCTCVFTTSMGVVITAASVPAIAPEEKLAKNGALLPSLTENKCFFVSS